MTPLAHLVPGPDRHGVVLFGVALDAALAAVGHPTSLRRSLDPGAGAGVHAQFTDRLYGKTPREAAAAITTVADHVHHRGRCLTVTLHDVPQPSDGTHHAERVRAYAQVCAAADGVILCSDHERMLLAENHVAARRLDVVPLPMASPAVPPPPPPTEPAVGVFGFLYPGKGHREVLDAMAGLPPSVPLIAIGEPSAGHHDLVDDLTRHARSLGRPFVVTGHVPGGELDGVLRGVAVPVAHHRHVSASGSLNAWLGAGRRPLAPRSRYTHELAHRNPGALTLYPGHGSGLSLALSAAWQDRASTWLPPGTRCAPTAFDAAHHYARTLTEWHG